MAAKSLVQVEVLSPLRIDGQRLEIGGVCELPQSEAEALASLQFPAVKTLAKQPVEKPPSPEGEDKPPEGTGETKGSKTAK